MSETTDRRGVIAGVLAPGDPDMRMDAYYYGFESTGIGIVDRILSAVAIAGKGCHNTDGWTDDGIAAYYDDGLTHEQRIQKAADDAAAALRALGQGEGEREGTTALARVRDVLRRFDERVEASGFDPLAIMSATTFVEAERLGYLDGVRTVVTNAMLALEGNLPALAEAAPDQASERSGE